MCRLHFRASRPRHPHHARMGNMPTTPDDILAAIDDVIAWHGSSDAMVWTADPPRPLTLPAFPRPQMDPDAMRRAGEMMAAQMQAFVEAFVEATRPVAEQMIRDAAAAGRAFAALAATPQMRDLSEARRASRRAMKSEYARRRRRR